jgi:6-phosphogluconolactonase
MDIVINHAVVQIFSETAALFQEAAIDFIQRAIKTVNEQQQFTVVLSGGETPKFFFDALVKNSQVTPQIPWEKIKFFFADERYVALDDAASNYHLAHEYLFSKLPIPAENIYRIPTELEDPHQAASVYEQTLRKVFNNKQDELPRFDVVYLGLGANGHTASLMPESDVVRTYLDAGNKIKALVAAQWVLDLQMYRITLTPPILNNSKRVCFVVEGASKALAVSRVLQGSFKPLQYPAQLIKCIHGKVVWFLDQKAAEKL